MIKSYSDLLVTNNKRFNVRVNISQCKSTFYTQILVLLKYKLLYVHLRADAIAV